MGARTDMINNNTTTTTTAAADDVGTPSTSTKLSSWKARAARFRGRRDSSGGGTGGGGGGVREPSPDVLGDRSDSNHSLQAQRNKNKKNWRGSLRNLLPKDKERKDAEGGSPSNPQTPAAPEAAASSRVSACTCRCVRFFERSYTTIS